MISLIRMKSLSGRVILWDEILRHKDKLQSSLEGKGQMLYLSKRVRHSDLSLFVHSVDTDILGEFIAEHLIKIEQIEDIWVIHLIEPAFYPLPKDTKDMKRFTITLKVFPQYYTRIYQNIAAAALPEDLQMAYIAFTFHLFGDSIQFSVLAPEEERLRTYMANVVNKLPGVLNSTVNLIEKTKPLVTYEAWKRYSSEHQLVQSWDEELMLDQFRELSDV